ncbi:flagellar hook-basal body complex protein [Thermosipho ferrireducens]|uniref:Flagellar hook protein FlgE n=1 Tax=Thermosipho ferrireducens TaxID=2571116 RepID=A0ABX7S841_9BACT|nr:flagellar hook-basal body complex protein [Thermosipho ferrireducens]QTA38764.1 flagellar hook-basal body complex protein [Thermosipho ferrireducens]
MIRSIYSGVTGLQGFQQAIDVVGNNIANVNTIGFKASRVTYATTFSQILELSKRASSLTGGTNPKQIGYGVKVASIDKIMSQGSFQNTGKKTDLAIQGDGFFILRDGTGKTYFTRAGNFDLDVNGTIIQPTSGLKLQGWIAEPDPESGKRFVDTNKPISDIQISAGLSMAAKKTTFMSLSNNLDARVGPEKTVITLSGYAGKNVDVKILYDRDIGGLQEPFSDYQIYRAKIYNGSDDTPDGEIYIKFDKFGNVVQSGAIKQTLSVTASADGSVTLNNILQSDGNYTFIIRDSNGKILDVQTENVVSGSTTVQSSVIQNGSSYTIEIATDTADVATTGYELDTQSSLTPVSDGQLDFTYNGSTTSSDVRIFVRDSSGKVIGSYLIEGGLSNGSSYSIYDSNITTSDTYSIEIYETDKVNQLVVSGSGEPRFYEADNPTNFVVTDFNSPFYTTSVQVYDTLGNAYTLYIDFVKLSANYYDGNDTYKNAWAFRIRNATGEAIKYLTNFDTGQEISSGTAGVLTFDESGRFTGLFSFNPDTGRVNRGEIIDAIKFNASENGDGEVKIKLRLSDLTQFAAISDAYVNEQNGNAQGTLESFSIAENGDIIGTFSNGLTDKLGKVALAIFNNPAGLLEAGNSLYVESANSGSMIIRQPASGGAGSLVAGALEMSNVDLSEEFTKLIIAQRGFQANARVVTTADQILQEVVNLRR